MALSITGTPQPVQKVAANLDDVMAARPANQPVQPAPPAGTKSEEDEE